ncbi:MAG: hypothetical protein HQL98_02590 [Magnetococcales bacterium]|nr:hypothetical protein [Magnetococcales bacterium]
MKKNLLMVALLLGLTGGVASAADLSSTDLSGLSKPLILASADSIQSAVVVDEDQSTVLDKKKKKKKKKAKKAKQQKAGANDFGAGAGSSAGQWDTGPAQ